MLRGLAIMNITQTDRGLALDCMLDAPHALHARPAARIAQTAREFKANILIIADTGEADAKSMLDILSLAPQPNTKLRLLADGPDAREALLAIYNSLPGNEP